MFTLLDSLVVNHQFSGAGVSANRICLHNTGNKKLII